MDHQTATTFGFGMDFSNVDFTATDFAKSSEGNTQNGFLFGDESFGDEAIDTTTCPSFDQTFDSMSTPMYTLPVTDPAFSVQQNLTMDNTLGGNSAWIAQLDFTTAPAQPFGSYQPFNSNMKRPLQLDTQEFPQSKRHEGAGYASNFTSPFLPSASLTTPSWTMDTQTTPCSTSADVGLSDEAADVCATWFSKYAVLPNDLHIDSLSQLTGEPASAIRLWFGQMLKQGLAGHDSAYKSQTSLSQPHQSMNENTTQSQIEAGPSTCTHETTTSPPLRGGKKGCTPTNNPELLSRDPNKIYQCTRKCGKRYGRKCDWKRNEEEGYPSKSWICSLCVSQGVEKVKPCFRRYHFSQHFRNIHAGIDSAEYEESSFVQSETGFPRRCGFCPHRFESRQDRIDHIAAHFKKGKCMLDWNDEDDDNHDSDDVDGDDDDDSFDGQQDQNGSSSEGPAKHGHSGDKQQEGGNNGNGGGDGSFSGPGRFQLPTSQRGGARQCSIPEPDIPQGVPQDFGRIITEGPTTSSFTGKQDSSQSHSSWTQSPDTRHSLPSSEAPTERAHNQKSQSDENIGFKNAHSAPSTSEGYWFSKQSSRYEETARNDAHVMARDAISRSLMSPHLPQLLHTGNQVEATLLGDIEIVAPPYSLEFDQILTPPLPGPTLPPPLIRPDGAADCSASNFRHEIQDERRLPQTPIDAVSQEGIGLDNGARRHPQLEPTTEAEAKSKGITSLQDLHKLIHHSDKELASTEDKKSVGLFVTGDAPTQGSEVLKGASQVASHASNSTDIPTVDDKLESFQTTHGLLASVHAAISGDNLDKLTGVPPPDRRLSEEASSTAADCCHTMARVENSYLKSQSFLSVKLLGTGGFSTVDEVVHRETKLRISRKTLKNREHSALEELKKEVNVLQKLRHPHIIRYLGAYTKDDKVSILLSPVAETNLAVWLEKCYLEKPAGLADTVMKMFGCLASSIRYLHEQRPVIKHMDIKPQNILVMHGSHDMPHVVLSDFGISSAEASTTAQNPTPLTRQYCAPEVPSRTSRGQAADIWSLGCVFLEMLAAAYHDTNGQWLDFRKEFSGRKGKYYWEEVPRLHDWISSFLDQAANYTEATVLRTVKSMVREEPVERPSAAMLTILFAPAPCCLSWPNEKASFPAPHEEFELAERLLREDGVAGQDRAQAPGVERPALLGGQDEHESFEIAKTWLRDCSKNHETCRPEASTAKVLPTRLIDIRPIGLTRSSVRLLNSSELPLESCPAEYAAISHIWTDQDLTLSTQRLQSMQDNLPREELPKALNDAIAVADRIGHRYIWVDSLCVIQDSAEDKRRECAMMASTYRNAVLTIVADATDTSSAVRQTSLPVIFPIDWEAPGFAWDTRPWCLQERLLCGRLLHLTSGQMYWDCHSLKASETFRRGLPSLVWEKVHTRSSIGRSAPLSSRRSPAEAPAIIRDCQFLRKEGDGISDAMSAQMQMALKAHPTSSSRKLEHPTLVASPVDELQPDFGVSAPPDSSFASAANVFDLDQVQETVKEKEKQKEKQKQKQKIIEEEKVDCLCGGAHRPKRSKGSLPVVDDRCGSRQMCTGMRPPCGLL